MCVAGSSTKLGAKTLNCWPWAVEGMAAGLAYAETLSGTVRPIAAAPAAAATSRRRRTQRGLPVVAATTGWGIDMKRLLAMDGRNGRQGVSSSVRADNCPPLTPQTGIDSGAGPARPHALYRARQCRASRGMAIAARGLAQAAAFTASATAPWPGLLVVHVALGRDAEEMMSDQESPRARR